MHPLEPITDAQRSLHAQLAAAGNLTSFLAFQKPQPHSDGVFQYHSIEEYHAAYLEGKTTPLAVAQNIITVLKNQKEHLNAVPEINEADILAQAAESTERYKSGRVIGLWTVQFGIASRDL